MKKILVILLILGLGVFSYIGLFLSSTSEIKSGSLVIEVVPGNTLSKVARNLKNQGIIKNAKLFRWMARLNGKASLLRVGEYEMSSGLTPMEVLTLITSGKSKERSVTIPEGYNMYEIFTLLESKGFGKKSEYLKLAKNKKFIKKLLGEELPGLEGYLFPETYSFNKYVKEENIIEIMVSRFLKVYNEVQKKSQFTWSRKKTVILASIIEKETGAPQERPLISSVFHNRLNKKMRLQTDPTILYGILDETGVMKKNITRKDLKTPNRYNTYSFRGLPYGPIASPGKEALSAALNPDPSKFLYFVSKNNGTHVFSENLKQHNKAVRIFQLDRKKRQGKSWRDLKKSKK